MRHFAVNRSRVAAAEAADVVIVVVFALLQAC